MVSEPSWVWLTGTLKLGQSDHWPLTYRPKFTFPIITNGEQNWLFLRNQSRYCIHIDIKWRGYQVLLCCIIIWTLTPFSRSQGSIIVFEIQNWNMARFVSWRAISPRTYPQTQLTKVFAWCEGQVSLTFIKVTRDVNMSHWKYIGIG